MRSIASLIQTGGPTIVPLLVLGMAGMLGLFERVAAISRRTRLRARPFMEHVISLVRSQKVEEALKVCSEHQASLPDLGLILLRSKSRDEVDLMHMARASALTVMPGVTRRLVWLPALATTSLLLGSLGGVTSLSHALSSGNASVALAVGQALQPVAVAIAIAIPLILGYAYLLNATATLSAQLDEFAARLVNALVGRPDVRLGHR